MKMRKYLSCLVWFTLFFIIGCSDMNDVHSDYLGEGEKVYIGKVDSLAIMPGNERVKLRFWVNDPRAKSVMFYWAPGDDSLYVELNRTSPLDSFEVMIGGEESQKILAEGSYTLRSRTSDNLGHFSLFAERNMRVYGEKYRSALIGRVLNSTEYDDGQNKLDFSFSAPFRSDDIGVEVKYTDLSGTVKRIAFPDSLLTSTVDISGFDVSKGVSYRTMFLPDTLAIDTFYTDFAPAPVMMTLNVALNKPATASGANSASDTADKAVDGLIGVNTSRWVSPASGEHWLEVDLQGEYAISGFNSWTGNAGALSHPTKNFYFQAWIGGEWVNLVEIADNSDPVVGASFPEVTTSKVRYFVPDYTGNRVRLYELEVYSVVTF